MKISVFAFLFLLASSPISAQEENWDEYIKRIEKQAEEKIQKERLEIESLVKLAPKDAERFYKSVNFIEDLAKRQPLLIGVVTYDDFENKSSIDIVSKNLVDKLGNVEHKASHEAVLQFIELKQDIKNIDLEKLVHVFNSESYEYGKIIDEISVPTIKKAKAIYCIGYPINGITAFIFLKEQDNIIRLKKSLSIANVGSLLQKAKEKDEDNVVMQYFIELIKNDSQIQKLIQDSANELLQTFRFN